METLIGIALVLIVLWGYWSFYGSGHYSAKRPPPDLSGFRSRSDNAAQDDSATPPTAEARWSGDVSDQA